MESVGLQYSRLTWIHGNGSKNKSLLKDVGNEALQVTYGFNADFQNDDAILQDEATFHKLSTLARDFQSAALQYGKVIISEKYLPPELKTIKPKTKELGGIAGGEKYIVQDILLKFAIDSKGIYGSDEFASKEAGHQLKGATSLFNAQSGHSKDSCVFR